MEKTIKLELTRDELCTLSDALSTEQEITEDHYKQVENYTDSPEEYEKEMKSLTDYVKSIEGILEKIKEVRTDEGW